MLEFKGFVEVLCDDFRTKISVAPTSEFIEYYDGKQWHFYLRDKK